MFPSVPGVFPSVPGVLPSVPECSRVFPGVWTHRVGRVARRQVPGMLRGTDDEDMAFTETNSDAILIFRAFSFYGFGHRPTIVFVTSKDWPARWTLARPPFWAFDLT